MSFILEPIITEKSVNLAEKSKYVFKVAPNATKNEVKKEIEKKFKVKVIAVNMLYQKPKIKRRGRTIGQTSSYKKAIVTLKQGDKIKELEIK